MTSAAAESAYGNEHFLPHQLRGPGRKRTKITAMKHSTKRALIGAQAPYEETRFNALRHGVLSRYMVVPGEDAEEYGAVLSALVAEHSPQGPTEEHFVEELAGIFWRKRRLRLAEAAAYRRGLEATLHSDQKTAKAALAHLGVTEPGEVVIDALRSTAAETNLDMATLKDDEERVNQALNILVSQRKDAYEAALKLLRAGTREWWGEELADLDKTRSDALVRRSPFAEKKHGVVRKFKICKDDPPPITDADRTNPNATEENLRQFLVSKVLPHFRDSKTILANRSLIREQAFGEAFNPDKMETLGRYEVHLDRKLERTLSMLLRLQDRRTVVNN